MRAAQRSSISLVVSVQQQQGPASKDGAAAATRRRAGLDGVGAEQFPGGQLVRYGTEGHGVVAVIAGLFQAAEGGRKVDVALAGGQVDCHGAGIVGQADCADAGDAESIAESINEAVYALRRQVGVVDG